MKFNRQRLGLLLVVLYLICTIITAFLSFSLSDDLTESGALGLHSIGQADGVLTRLFLTVTVTLLVGLGSLFYLLTNKTEEVVYVEKKAEKTVEEQQAEEDQQFTDLDISKIRKLAQGKKGNETELFQTSLVEICKELEAGLGAFYLAKKEKGLNTLQMTATYALSMGETQRPSFEFGEGLVGQVASEKRLINIDEVPEGYLKIVSGLGKAEPRYLLIVPVLKKSSIYGVAEIASFTPFNNGMVSSIEKAFEVVMAQLTEAKPAAKSTAVKNTKKE
ncbi:MAG: GAF domain-containing protein [Bacteroidota bacterium]